MKKKCDVLVSVLMGSDSDLSIMKEALETLKKFDIPYELFLTSAHRTPERTTNFARKAEERTPINREPSLAGCVQVLSRKA